MTRYQQNQGNRASERGMQPRDDQGRFESNYGQQRGWDRPRDENGRFESTGGGDYRYGQGRGGNGRSMYGQNEGYGYNRDRNGDVEWDDFDGRRADRSFDPDYDADYAMTQRNEGGYSNGRGDYGRRSYGGQADYAGYGRSQGNDRSYYSQRGNESSGYGSSYGGSFDRSMSGSGSSMGNSGWSSSYANGQDQSSSRGQFSGRGPKGYKRSDERIQEDVCEALSNDGQLDASEIEVKVSGGEVTLTGTVNERQHKRMAEDIVERCSGVHDVKNEIRVQRESGSDSEQQSSGSHSKTREMATSGSSKSSMSSKS